MGPKQMVSRRSARPLELSQRSAPAVVGVPQRNPPENLRWAGNAGSPNRRDRAETGQILYGLPLPTRPLNTRTR